MALQLSLIVVVGGKIFSVGMLYHCGVSWPRLIKNFKRVKYSKIGG